MDKLQFASALFQSWTVFATALLQAWATFSGSLVQAVAWPLLVGGLAFTFRKSIRSLAGEFAGFKFDLKLVDAGTGRVPAAPESVHGRDMGVASYRVYSNGMMVQTLTLRLPAGGRAHHVTYPLAFRKEVLSIQPIGPTAVTVLRAALGNCELFIPPGSPESEVELIITGL